ncbi:MAG: hypothetical protein ACXADY_10035 [Candidatus Hodarchaeales archaeon]|jgi:hypothetical protein
MSLFQSTLTKSQRIVLFVGVLITSFLGGLFLLNGDFAYCSYDTMLRFIGFNPYGLIGIKYAIEFTLQQALKHENPIPLIFFGLPCALFYNTFISLIGLAKPERSSLKNVILIGMILATITAIVSFLIGVYVIIEVISLSNRYSSIEWAFGSAFWGGLLGGALTTLFFFLIIRK